MTWRLSNQTAFCADWVASGYPILFTYNFRNLSFQDHGGGEIDSQLYVSPE